MSDTRLADILDGLYDLFAADATLAPLVTANTLRIFDGPPSTDYAAPAMLVVGGDVDPVDEDTTTQVQWDWATLGVDGAHASVDEVINVPCAIATVDGGVENMRTARRQAITIYAAAAAAVRGTTLGIDVVMWCIAGVSAIRQLQTASGAECLIRFDVHVRTRI